MKTLTYRAIIAAAILAAATSLAHSVAYGQQTRLNRINKALTMLFGIFPASACNCAYVKVDSGTVPGAVATGSAAPGRYRSRYRTD